MPPAIDGLVESQAIHSLYDEKKRLSEVEFRILIKGFEGVQYSSVLIFGVLPHDLLDIIEQVLIVVFSEILVDDGSFAINVDVILEGRNKVKFID